MDMGDIFRSFLGLGRRQSRQFPQLSPNDDEDDCGCDCDHEHFENDTDESQFPFFFGEASTSIDEMFRHFHGDMHRQMESLHRQMEDMMKGFGTITSEQFPPMDGPKIFNKPHTAPGEGQNETWFFGNPDTETDKSSPRDFMLKDSDKHESPNVQPVGPNPPDDSNSFRFSFNFKNPFKSLPSESIPQDPKEDTDLDGKVSNAEVMDLLKKSDRDRQLATQNPNREGFFSGSSVTMTTIRGPDGKTEQKKIVRDSSGREQSIISRSVDGQSHTVTTVTGPDGVEERREDFKNMDENDINKFEAKWKTLQPPQQPSSPLIQPSGPGLHPSDMDIFSKFFK